jgi:hypothetical protein
MKTDWYDRLTIHPVYAVLWCNGLVCIMLVGRACWKASR